MAEYLLAVHTDFDAAPGPDFDQEAVFKAVDEFNQELQNSGVWIFAGGLNPPSTATVVSSVDGEVTMTDGPYLETKEVLGGFWIVDVPDLDAALELAAKGSAACQGRVEVRPFQAE